jgi:predicted  nucleic acid-binding Zn-ribbon protein
MGESEPLDKNLKSAEVALGEERAQAEVEKREAMARTAQDKQALAEIQQERGQLVPRMNANLYGRYETVRRTRRGIAVAEALDGRCSACHMAMRLQFFQDLKKDDQVMSCESCGRMLYYNPPAAVEDLAGESAPAIRG